MEIMRAIMILVILLFIAIAVGVNRAAMAEKHYIEKRVSVVQQ